MFTKKIWIGTAALGGAVALGVGGLGVGGLGVGGLAAASASDAGSSGDRNDDQQLSGSTLDRASAAAIKAAGGGTVTDSEKSDDSGSAYELEVTTSKGQQVDVHLDKNFAVVSQEVDDENETDQSLTGDTLEQASAAAIKAAGGGTVTDSEKSDDSDSAYEVEVTRSNGEQVDVHLDQAFTVVKSEVDTED